MLYALFVVKSISIWEYSVCSSSVPKARFETRCETAFAWKIARRRSWITRDSKLFSSIVETGGITFEVERGFYLKAHKSYVSLIAGYKGSCTPASKSIAEASTYYYLKPTIYFTRVLSRHRLHSSLPFRKMHNAVCTDVSRCNTYLSHSRREDSRGWARYNTNF